MDVGTKVSWESQANGRTSLKVGTIAEVVSPEQMPSRQFTSLYRNNGAGLPRPLVSYVVLATSRTKGGRVITHRTPRPYWPLTAKLRVHA